MDEVKKAVLGSEDYSLWMYAEVWVLGVPWEEMIVSRVELLA